MIETHIQLPAEATATTIGPPAAQAPVRTRTYSWTDPLVTAAELGRRSGVETLRAIGRREVPPPPIMQTLGMGGIEAVEEGRVVFTLRAQEFHYNPLGTVHGGVIATMLDTCAGCAVHSTLPAGWGVRPVTVDSGMLRCEGTVVSRGRTTALGEARLFDEAGKLVAHATSSCLLFEV